MSERWRKVEDILQAALERPAAERPAFLNKICGGDEELKREVESLLAFEDRAEAFIETCVMQEVGDLVVEEKSTPLVGRTFGHYRVIALIGAGGMGEVYLAEDTRLGRNIALKVLTRGFTQDRQQLQRFEQEARAASALSHPNIMAIHDIGQADNTHYIVSELIDGETLRQRLSRGPMPVGESLDIVSQVAGALHSAHEAGIVHRDVKPENIMMRRDGFVKVLDFGLAKLQENTAGQPGLSTETGLVFGTPRYMSPEQARGQKVDGRSDIFSLGIVLYETLSGSYPFPGDTSADVIASLLQKDPVPISQFLADTPEALESITSRALEKKPEDRYQTVQEFLSDVRRLKQRLDFEEELERSGASTRARDASRRFASGETSGPWWRSNAVRAGVAVAVLAIVAAGLLLFLKPRGTPEQDGPLKDIAVTQLTDQPGPEYFPSLSPDGKSLIYVSGGSGNRDVYLQRIGGRNALNLTKDNPTDDTQPVFSPDAERIAFRSERDGGGIYLMRATGESVTRLTDFGYNPAWSPRGDAIAVATESTTQLPTRPNVSELWTINVASGERRLITEGDALQPSWSPGGHRIAYWSRPKETGRGDDIWTVAPDGSKPVQVTNDRPIDWNPVWSPDGKYLYFSSTRGGSMNVWRIPIDEQTGTVLGQPEAVTLPAASAQHLSFSADGSRLAYVAQEMTRNLKKVNFDPASRKIIGEQAWITKGSLQLWFPDLSPDGEWLVCYSTSGQQRHLYLMRSDGSGLRDLIDDEHRYYWPRWSPDGKLIAFSARRTGVYELWLINRDGSGLRQLTYSSGEPGAHYAPWSPDGMRIAYSVHNPRNECFVFQPGTAWSEQTPDPLPQLSDPHLSFEAWSWSPDGKKLAGVRHLPDNSHAGIGIYDLQSRTYRWITDFGDWPLWLNDGKRLLFVAHGKVHLIDGETGKYQTLFSVTDEEVDIGSPGLTRDNRAIYFSAVTVEADIWTAQLGR
jgi:serine/threonine protein kinase